MRAKRPQVATRGSWNVWHDERFAELIEKAILTPDDTLTNSDPINRTIETVGEDHGLFVEGVR